MSRTLEAKMSDLLSANPIREGRSHYVMNNDPLIRTSTEGPPITEGCPPCCYRFFRFCRVGIVADKSLRIGDGHLRGHYAVFLVKKQT